MNPETVYYVVLALVLAAFVASAATWTPADRRERNARKRERYASNRARARARANEERARARARLATIR